MTNGQKCNAVVGLGIWHFCLWKYATFVASLETNIISYTRVDYNHRAICFIQSVVIRYRPNRQLRRIDLMLNDFSLRHRLSPSVVEERAWPAMEEVRQSL